MRTIGELKDVLALLGVTDVKTAIPHGGGHINETYKVETASGRVLILQRVNEAIFDLPILEKNVIRVTEYLRSRGVPTLEILAYKGAWRLMTFCAGESQDVVREPAQAYCVGRAFAQFQDALADLPPPRLQEVIPHFHDTPHRLQMLDEACRADVKGRLSAVSAELDFVAARREAAGRLVNGLAQGRIPERITQNDTKINNVLIGGEGSVTVIDLDTVMPGAALYDFGDMVRTSTALAAEDEPNLARVGSRKDYFEALVRGYLAGAKFLTEAEKDELVFAGQLMTFEVGVRFLTDYLSGDTYFHTAYSEHNLIRARNQFAMVASLEAQDSEYTALVEAIRKEEKSKL